MKCRDAGTVPDRRSESQAGRRQAVVPTRLVEKTFRGGHGGSRFASYLDIVRYHRRGTERLARETVERSEFAKGYTDRQSSPRVLDLGCGGRAGVTLTLHTLGVPELVRGKLSCEQCIDDIRHTQHARRWGNRLYARCLSRSTRSLGDPPTQPDPNGSEHRAKTEGEGEGFEPSSEENPRNGFRDHRKLLQLASRAPAGAPVTRVGPHLMPETGSPIHARG